MAHLHSTPFRMTSSALSGVNSCTYKSVLFPFFHKRSRKLYLLLIFTTVLNVGLLIPAHFPFTLYFFILYLFSFFPLTASWWHSLSEALVLENSTLKPKLITANRQAEALHELVNFIPIWHLNHLNTKKQTLIIIKSNQIEMSWTLPKLMTLTWNIQYLKFGNIYFKIH